jgi:hypothetical protein
LCADDAGHDAALVEAGAELEALETVAVDVLKEGAQLDGKVDENGAKMVAALCLKGIGRKLLQLLVPDDFLFSF